MADSQTSLRRQPADDGDGNGALSSVDDAFLREAIDEARGGYGFVDPNPLVGAVIVDQAGKIVARGHHEQYGQAHAERNALADARAHGVDVTGMTMYVSLEPCSHYGKTPPCAPFVAESGISRVVIASLDSNPKVNGRGVRILSDAGVHVDIATGPVREEAEDLNDAFFYFLATGAPLVTWKYAMSLDGKIAAADGSPWRISGTAAHERVHNDRARMASVITGIGTVLLDNPRLTARPTTTAHVHQPLRVIVDSALRTPLDSNLVRESAGDHLTLIATCSADSDRIDAYKNAGCDIVTLPAAPFETGDVPREGAQREGIQRVSIPALIAELGGRRIDSALLESGGTLAAAFLQARAVQKIEAFVSPVVLGAASAPTPAMGAHAVSQHAAHLPRIGNPKITRYDNDVLIEGRID
ncbi:MAG: bifunctional diaminohydroxyphosphoribosylaminopyrimidine deaminase/5-amino-6-(5-phosphoribosylamino)uracil reductase RibD [Bifidobacteriaceae bacterium]|nr:bifunctional diaminohydroxyphosphoribosylaminopyrimidine deaminase/5-amino-6-(5-phosphoribosylamino)uracil reductase RibD [Bifidobacteriaceae bacterium]